jgi:molybdopterin converting factor small subunit
VVRLFGPARQAAGVARTDIPGATVSEVLRTAEERYGAEFTAVVAVSSIWVNGASTGPGTPVTDHDEVAVVPPVSGG